MANSLHHAQHSATPKQERRERFVDSPPSDAKTTHPKFASREFIGNYILDSLAVPGYIFAMK